MVAASRRPSCVETVSCRGGEPQPGVDACEGTGDGPDAPPERFRHADWRPEWEEKEPPPVIATAAACAWLPRPVGDPKPPPIAAPCAPAVASDQPRALPSGEAAREAGPRPVGEAVRLPGVDRAVPSGSTTSGAAGGMPRAARPLGERHAPAGVDGGPVAGAGAAAAVVGAAPETVAPAPETVETELPDGATCAGSDAAEAALSSGSGKRTVRCAERTGGTQSVPPVRSATCACAGASASPAALRVRLETRPRGSAASWCDRSSSELHSADELQSDRTGTNAQGVEPPEEVAETSEACPWSGSGEGAPIAVACGDAAEGPSVEGRRVPGWGPASQGACAALAPVRMTGVPGADDPSEPTEWPQVAEASALERPAPQVADDSPSEGPDATEPGPAEPRQ